MQLQSKPISRRQSDAAERAVASAQPMTTSTALRQAMDREPQYRTIGLDTEFVRERTFYPRPGLVQLSNGQEVWLLDAVAVEHAPALGELLTDTSTLKVLHSVGEDLEILHMVSGQWPEPLFDTQVAAALLGQPLQLRYEHLVHAVLGVEPDGGKGRNNWCRRPLAPALLKYAAEDVIWLPALAEQLSEQLERADRMDWLREDCDRIVTTARAGDQTPAVSRVKGAGRLSTPELALLDALSRWRDEQARTRDLPRRFVLDDETLLAMAQAALRGQLGQQLDALSSRQRRAFAAEIEAALAQVNVDAYQRPAMLDAFSAEERDRLRELQKAVGQVAAGLQVEPAVLASKKELARLLRGEHPEWLDGWRKPFLADAFRAASVDMPLP